MNAKNLYSKKFFEKVDFLKKGNSNKIFVILGQTSLLDIEKRQEFFVDLETFQLEKNEQTFSKEWFAKVFTTLNEKKDYHIISFAQFSYLINYIDPSFFIERVVIIKDNLRQLFPINKKDYIEKGGKENMELRPKNLPIYQAEQITTNGKYFYIAKTPLNSFEAVDLFEEGLDLNYSTNQNLENIDISSEPYSIDLFVNDCFEQNNLNRQAVVKFSPKQPLNPSILDSLKKTNAILNKFGGSLFFLEEEVIPDDYQIGEKSTALLKRFWGENAKFKNLSIYRNPDFSNEIIEISQGIIVDIIIKEYENALIEKPCRDLFLTAPTGAGKSLLFQLPAFYVSEKGDVTIVVSPLIALMKDQIRAIIEERKFEKAAFLNSELNLFDRDRIIESCKNGEIDILYMSPELLLSYDITHFIGTRRLGLLVIDEAHLITTWGRDFRVDYWFLGNHIRKIRKFNNLRFPMVAVTATAIYGGANDMVFDSIDSLVMHNPYKFIGQVKRNDIEFIVNNYEKFTKNFDSSKITQTVEFLKEIADLEVKTLVYTPYTRQIRQIIDGLSLEKPNIATGYHGSLDSQSKEFAYRQFKSGERKIMISTKAFGMGVDISDIQVIYHHAPSGLLPDYVQEIGRAARDPKIKGFATLNYSSQDQRYTKALHGMSAIRQYQLKEVLKKIHKSFLKNKMNRNLLISIDDFGYIFENASDLDQKVLTALMMIEKDYLAKNRFNVIIARPKKLFVKVFARISDQHLKIFNARYQKSFKILKKEKNGQNIIEIDLDNLWLENFGNKSFPSIKRDFYTGYLFKNDNIEVIPQLKMSFERLEEINIVLSELQSFLDKLESVFSNFNGFFNQEDFQNKLNQILNDENKAEKLSKFILSSYSGRVTGFGVIEPNAFLQRRKVVDGFEYRVFSNQYLSSFSSLLKRFNKLFENNKRTIAERYVTSKEINAINYVRLGYFLELLELGTFEVKGGENPMVFIRINDPNRIERDSKSQYYSNTLLNKTLERHYLSNQIFDHFFLRSFSNSERWDFIEDFFLGSGIDQLLEEYKGGEVNHIGIIETLKTKKLKQIKVKAEKNQDCNVNIFFPIEGKVYCPKDLLTIEDESGTKTMKISEWLEKAPKSFDLARRKNSLLVNTEVFEILVSKLKAYEPEYFIEALGLKARIEFKGYDGLVQATVPYNDKPLEFYKWWCDNPHYLTLTFKEKLVLFDKVNMINPSVLKEEHISILNKK